MVATWDTRVTWSRKNGILVINRDYMHELEIICTTCLAMYGESDSFSFFTFDIEKLLTPRFSPSDELIAIERSRQGHS